MPDVLDSASLSRNAKTVGELMFSYMALGTNDLARAIVFYDAVLAPLGHHRIAEHDRDATSAAWGLDDPGPHLWVTLPFDGQPATIGNGVMVSFLAPTQSAVDAFYKAALAAGGADEGPPGLRPQYGPHFYAAYVRDPDGNKINAVCYSKASADTTA
jgi:catechol 2,3-dioxygenase-like lactoylglutathione lyase family enzyme